MNISKHDLDNLSVNITQSVLDCLIDRRGFDDWFYGLDLDICNEIKDELLEAVSKEIDYYDLEENE